MDSTSTVESQPTGTKGRRSTESEFLEASGGAERLSALAGIIRSCIRDVYDFDTKALEVARQSGEALLEAKALIPYGQFDRWRATQANVGNTARCRTTQNKHMRIAKEWTFIEKLRKENPELGPTEAYKAISDASKPSKGIKYASPTERLHKLSRRLWDSEKYGDAEKARRQLLIHEFVDCLREGYRKRKPVGCVQSHFLDSGSFSLQKRAAAYQLKNGGSHFGYYTSPEFHEYRDAYARFVNRYPAAIDFYANVDVIGNSELTWRNQQYLELTHGCKPVPVVHYGADPDLKWLKHYVDRGYGYIGLGGLAGNTSKRECREWIDRCFEATAGQIKFHGFGVGTQPMMSAFRWHSVDTANWMVTAKNGSIYVPPCEDGEFRFDKPPLTIHLASMEAPAESQVEETPSEETTTPYKLGDVGEDGYRHIRKWLKSIGIPYGKNEAGKIKRKGVTNWHEPRRVANLIYLTRVAEHLGYLRLYFSASGSRETSPEIALGDDANIMLTYYELHHDPAKGKLPARFRRILAARRRTQRTATYPPD